MPIRLLLIRLYRKVRTRRELGVGMVLSLVVVSLLGNAVCFYVCDGRAAGKTFGETWAHYFEIESLAEDAEKVGGGIGRKRSYFWSVLGDWTLRLTAPVGR